MEKITSQDGTPIACWKTGEGPPLVLIHGSISDHSYWEPILPELQRHFAVYTIDRRGFGQSGDYSDVYSIEQEYEDVAAVVYSIGTPVNLMGHSYGAICALEGARLTFQNVHKLILYEPPINASNPPGFVERLEAMLDAGDKEGVITTFMREMLGLEPEEVPEWQELVPFAHTLPRELRASEAYAFDAKRFDSLRIPTLCCSGDESPPFLQEGSQVVAEALPDTRIAVMSGHGHEAVETGPDLLVREVVSFLT
jgi:pimeloyl-ACP methyl ester carboxylesterase